MMRMRARRLPSSRMPTGATPVRPIEAQPGLERAAALPPRDALCDVSERTIPTDRVDEEQPRQPAHWDTRLIRRFMTFFGPLSSVFDFATFGRVPFFRTKPSTPLAVSTRPRKAVGA